MSTQINLYDLLGVKTDADEVEIKRAYRKLAAKTHPDVGGEAMASLFMGIQKAYETLSDPKLRADYDNSLNNPQQRPERPEQPAGEPSQHNRTAPRNTVLPSYDWEWSTTVVPTDGIAFFAKRAKSEDGKRFVKARYTQRIPFTPIFLGALTLWLVSLTVRQGVPVPASIADTPALKLMGFLQLSHIGAVAVAVFSKKLKAAKGIIAALLGLSYLMAPTIMGFAVTRTPDFIPPAPAVFIATVTLVVSALAIIWSLYEQGLRKLNLKAVGIPRNVNDWTMVNGFSRESTHPAARHAEMIADLVTRKLPGTKMFLNVAISGRDRIPLVVVNGNRAAMIEIMDTSASNLPEDINSYRWDQFRWEKTSLGDKSLIFRRTLPQHMELKTFLLVYPAHAGSHEGSYRLGKNEVQVTAVSDVELGNIMGSWLADGSNVGGVDTDLIYTLMTGNKLSAVR